MRNILATLALTLSTTANAVEVNIGRTYVINGEIGDGNILPIGQDMLEKSVSGDTKEPVDVIINSPGGDVVTGFLFLNLMKTAQKNGLVVRCFVPTMAASMAFHILVHCSERYAVSKSFLLWHRARVFVGGLSGTAFTSVEAGALSTQLKLLDATILREVVKALQINPATTYYHFDRETMHTGDSLSKLAPKFITVLDVIPNLFEAMLLPSIRGGNADMKYKPGDLIYIKRGVID